MRDNLNLDDLREYLEHEKQRKARLKLTSRIVTGAVLGLVILTFVLNSSFWLFDPLVVLLMIGIIFSSWSLYYWTQLITIPFRRARQVVERVLVRDQIVYSLHMPARAAVEAAIFSTFGAIGIIFLAGYRREGIPVTPTNIVADLSIAPDWAVPFLLGWGTAISIAVVWLFRLWRGGARLSRRDRRQLISRYASQSIGLAIMLAAAFVIALGLPWPYYMLIAVSVLLQLSNRISYYLQRFLLNRYVTPLIVMGRYAEADRHLQYFLRLRPNAYHWQYFEAVLAFYTCDYARAEQLWLRWLIRVQNLDTRSIGLALTLLSFAMSRQKHYEDAMRYAECAVDADPAGATGYQQLSNIYMDMEVEPGRALECYDFARSLQPKSSPLDDSGYAVVLAHNGEFETSEAILRDIDVNLVTSVPDRAAFEHNKAVVAQLQGDLAKAHEHYEQAVQIDPNGNVGCMAREMLQKLDE